jgi:dolichol-phosphate mannosyltransferase
MSESVAEVASELPSVGLAAGRDVWVVLPTYNERENLERIASAILASLPEASLLIVDDSSPDGTGELADTLAAHEPRVSVLHRPAKQGLGVAYRDGFRWVLERPDAKAVVQMDADFSHDPADLPRLLAPLMGNADLVLGTRYIRGGATVGWPRYRRLISRAGTLFARTVLLLPYRDLTGGFKAWRRELLESIRLRETSGTGYGFQIETTWWAHRRGASIVQVPIVFRERTAGASKMTGGIVGEAMRLVVGLRVAAVADWLRRRLVTGCMAAEHRLGWRLARISRPIRAARRAAA